ncbi:hypothetical protein C5E04_16530 [Pectobacterium parmentieri]|uniref:hypothetical protein n=1 Tax=Pectobacterium parmentieri TaxID=1905730 RepID=UPI000EB118A8|nr:hypothetical protein [Pectobacterium parmentieri]RKO80840.1 hypothetical protein C5E04_16530 [Pectobacterium parmentieri]
MNKQVEFYMEPVRFFKNPLFLSGSKMASSKHDVITKKDDALKLIFSQDVPSGYWIWDDFFSGLISELILDDNYDLAQKSIVERVIAENDDTLKETIRKRKEYLIRKKAGLAGNSEYDEFVKEVGDECNYMLMILSVQRYLKGEGVNNKLEELFDIFKMGFLPCGVKKNANEIVVFDPSVLTVV